MSAQARDSHLPELEAVLESAHEAFISIDEEGRIRAWNREAERTFGWAKEAVVGELVRDVLIPARHRSRHEHGLRRFLETGEGPLLNKRLELTALHRSGREIPVELTISAVRHGAHWSFNAFLHDISERYRAHELQARLATLVEHSGDAIVSRTSEGAITSWNPGAERLFGYSAGEMLRRSTDVLVPEDRRDEAKELAGRVVSGEVVHNFETERLTKDGRRIDVSLTISPIRDDAGRVSEVAMFFRDITTTKEAQRALADAYEELRRTSELKNHILAIASHELGTPLRSIVGFASVLLSRWGELSDERKRRYLRLIEEQGQRLTDLVDEVLLLSKIEAGMVERKAIPVDLVEVARDVRAELGLDAECRVAAEGDAVVLGNPRHLHQIILNFVANASLHGEQPLSVEIAQDHGAIVARVCDGGDGVPDAFVPKLFEPYTRARDDDATRGSGLGLAIAKGLAEAAGGEVWYEPRDPRGACFCLRLGKAV
jgi:PAS domain S-box-containing protein